MNRLIASRPEITKPVIDKVFAFEDSVKAFEHLESQKHVGKVVIKVAWRAQPKAKGNSFREVSTLRRELLLIQMKLEYMGQVRVQSLIIVYPTLDPQEPSNQGTWVW